jgi:carboxyl-terminal processing protease
MNGLNKTLKLALVVSVIVVGAALFYAAGLGTGLYIAQATAGERTNWLDTGAPVAPGGVPTPVVIEPAVVTPTLSISACPSQDEEESFAIFWEAWHVLEQEFYGDLPPEPELPYAAIEGVIDEAGDPYTAFLDPVRAEILSSDLSGTFEGIGATVRLRPDERLEIVQPLPDGPAIKAGLRAGDVILQVDGTDLEGMSLYEAISLIRGPAGTVVHLLVERQEVDEPVELDVERARIELEVVASKMLENGIAYVQLSEFGETATTKLVSALRMLNTQEPEAYILDLRGNRGGYLHTAIEVTSQFVGQSPIVVERFKDGREQKHRAIPGGIALDVPLVVLVDGASASASEIAAGAIQDTGRGVLIGTRTLGKGSVQVAHTLSDGSQLRVTIARWFTPNGRAIHGQGLEPDIQVERTEEDMATGRDPQLERAIAYLLEGK